MIILDTKYQEANDFLASMGYKRNTIDGIIRKKIDWEKEFIIQRAKEERVAYMEEFFENFYSIVGLDTDKRNGNREVRKVVRDLKTGIIYNSCSEIGEKLGVTNRTITNYICNGRFEIININNEIREENDFYFQSVKIFKFLTFDYIFYLDEVEKKDNNKNVLERAWMLNQVRKKEQSRQYKKSDFCPTKFFPVTTLRSDIVKKIKKIAGSKIIESLFYDPLKKDYVFMMEE